MEGIFMKTTKIIANILVTLAAVAGAVYVIATYGDKIVAWAKKMLGCCPCDGECECCDCECFEEEAVEEAIEEAAEEVAEIEEAAEEPVAAEADFEG
jgi:hypothetical protein